MKSATRFHFAELNRQRRRTGNPTQDVLPTSHDIYDKVKEVIGDSHKNGTNLISEIGINEVYFIYGPFYIECYELNCYVTLWLDVEEG